GVAQVGAVAADAVAGVLAVIGPADPERLGCGAHARVPLHGSPKSSSSIAASNSSSPAGNSTVSDSGCRGPGPGGSGGPTGPSAPRRGPQPGAPGSTPRTAPDGMPPAAAQVRQAISGRPNRQGRTCQP